MVRYASLVIGLPALVLQASGQQCGYDCGSPATCSSCTGWSSSAFCKQSSSNCESSCGGLWCGGSPSPPPVPPSPVPTPSPAPEPTPPGPSPPPSQGRCSSIHVPSDSRCTGCPPMKDGKLCASTTRYFDQTKGACGCGNTDPVPRDWWTKTKFTAALNCKNLDPSDPHKAWCPSQCGGCYKLCSTGGTTQGTTTDPDVCRVFKVENRCGDGFDGQRYDYWCSQELTWQECQADPEKCKHQGSTNMYGYTAHFDLQDLNKQVSGGLGWNNVEVTFEPVSCSEWQGPQWDCQCPSGSSNMTSTFFA